MKKLANEVVEALEKEKRDITQFIDNASLQLGKAVNDSDDEEYLKHVTLITAHLGHCLHLIGQSMYDAIDLQMKMKDEKDFIVLFGTCYMNNCIKEVRRLEKARGQK